jgi:hypothetical protein
VPTPGADQFSCFTGRAAADPSRDDGAYGIVENCVADPRYQ